MRFFVQCGTIGLGESAVFRSPNSGVSQQGSAQGGGGSATDLHLNGSGASRSASDLLDTYVGK